MCLEKIKNILPNGNGDESHGKIRENHELNKSKLANHLDPLIITIDG